MDVHEDRAIQDSPPIETRPSAVREFLKAAVGLAAFTFGTPSPSSITPHADEITPPEAVSPLDIEAATRVDSTPTLFSVAAPLVDIPTDATRLSKPSIAETTVELTTTSLPTIAQARPDFPVILVGGGPTPTLASELFSRWSGDKEILVIAWGSKIPDVYFNDVKTVLENLGAKKITRMPDLDDALRAISRSTEDSPDALDPRHLIKNAKGIYICGGVQTRLLHAIAETKSGEILIEWIRKNTGPIAGTSAGTALLGSYTIGGSGTIKTSEVFPGQQPIQHGLAWAVQGSGVLENVLTDQHFDKKETDAAGNPCGREPRLRSVLGEAPAHIEWGIGVDEGSAAVVTEHRFVDVVGPGTVTIIPRNPDGSCGASIRIRQGMRFDLKLNRIFEMQAVPENAHDFFYHMQESLAQLNPQK